MAIVVSDTSPIRALQHLDLLDLLRELYGLVYLPEVVCKELRQGSRRFPALEPAKYSLFIIESPRDLIRVSALEEQLDSGEAAALALALKLKADYVLIDERVGRQIARELHLSVIGLLGVLLRAKEAGFIATIAPLIRRLQCEIDFRLAPDLVAEVLRLAGEEGLPC